MGYSSRWTLSGWVQKKKILVPWIRQTRETSGLLSYNRYLLLSQVLVDSLKLLFDNM